MHAQKELYKKSLFTLFTVRFLVSISVKVSGIGDMGEGPEGCASGYYYYYFCIIQMKRS